MSRRFPDRLHAATPVCLDDSFFSVALENGTQVSVVWLVALHGIEAEYVRSAAGRTSRAN